MVLKTLRVVWTGYGTGYAQNLVGFGEPVSVANMEAAVGIEPTNKGFADQAGHFGPFSPGWYRPVKKADAQLGILTHTGASMQGPTTFPTTGDLPYNLVKWQSPFSSQRPISPGCAKN